MHFQNTILPSKKTKGWISAFSVFFIIALYIIVWVLVGEIDALNLKWFITAFVNDENVQRTIYLNPNVIYCCLSPIIVSIIGFLVLKFWVRKANWDYLPFLIMANIAGWVWIFSGFIPFNKSNVVWIIIGRFILMLVSSLIIFFIVNAFTSKVLLKNNDSAYIYEEIKNEYIELNRMKKEQDMFANKNKDKEKNYIEIEEEE